MGIPKYFLQGRLYYSWEIKFTSGFQPFKTLCNKNNCLHEKQHKQSIRTIFWISYWNVTAGNKQQLEHDVISQVRACCWQVVNWTTAWEPLQLRLLQAAGLFSCRRPPKEVSGPRRAFVCPFTFSPGETLEVSPQDCWCLSLLFHSSLSLIALFLPQCNHNIIYCS